MSHHSHLPPEADEAVRSFIRRHKHGLRWGCLAAGLLALGLGLVVAWGLVRGTLGLKNWVLGMTPSLRIPLQWEQPLGDSALAQIRGQVRFLSDPQVMEPLNRLAAPLFAGMTNTADRFTLFVTESKQVNALALPGGYLVFHRGLLERARTAEEVQGVLAHEMAHIQQRHVVLQLMKNIGLDLARQQLQGGENRVLDALIRDSSQLLGLKFSRDHERAADDRGWEILTQSQINPQGMVDFFAGLKAEADAKGADGSTLAAPLLSTHPAPQERIDRLRQRQSTLVGREFKSYAPEFRALQTGLGILLEKP